MITYLEKMATTTTPPFVFDLVKCENEKSDGEASISSLLPVSSSQVSVRRIQSSLCDVMRSIIMKVFISNGSGIEKCKL